MRYFAITILFLLIFSEVSASEFIGTISTNPNDPKGLNDIVKPSHHTSSKPPVENEIAIQKIEIKEEIENKSTEQPTVKGLVYYPDSSLLRDDMGTVYILKGKYKKKIFTLAELAKYQGQEILDVATEVLARYETKNYWPGDLIRQIGDDKVYVLLKAGKKHIKSLEELAQKYFGQEIHNLTPAEIKNY
jgi:hypothetical protein